jgi:hypothetical protein
MKKTVQIGVILGCVLFLFFLSEPDALLEEFSDLSPTGVIASLVALFLSQVVGHLRLQCVLRSLGYPVPFLSVMRAGVAGLYGALILFGVVGQSISRIVLLRRDLVPGDVAVLATWIERIVALAVLLLLAGTLGSQLIGRQPELTGGSFIYPSIILGLFTICILAIFASRPPAGGEKERAKLAIWRVSRPMLPAAALTLPVHLLTLFAYCVVLSEVAPDLTVPEMLGFSATVMLAASLPISFAGWGVRELSAVVMATTLGLAAEIGVVLGVVIGGLSVLGLLLSTLIVGLKTPNQASRSSVLAPPASEGVRVDARYWTDIEGTRNVAWLVFWTIPLSAAVGLFFSLRIPTISGEITVSLADPLSIMIALICVGHLITERAVPELWVVKGVHLAFFLITGAILVSFAHGYWSFGWSDWAFYNRVLGWPMLLAHCAAGASIVWAFGARGQSILFHCIVISAGALGMLALIYYPIAQEYRLPWLMVDGLLRLEGTSRNANSTALQFLIASGVAAVLAASAAGRSDRLRYMMALIFASAVVVLTMSRVAFVVAVCLIIFFILFDRRIALRLGGAFAMTALLLIGWLSFQNNASLSFLTANPKGDVASVGILSTAETPMIASAPTLALVSVLAASHSRAPIQVVAVGQDDLAPIAATSKTTPKYLAGIAHRLKLREDRVDGILDGIDRWLRNPILGAGLGSHVQEQLRNGQIVSVIHSGYVWILAELGLVGLIAFMSLLIPIIQVLRMKSTVENGSLVRIIVIIVAVMALFNVLHDMVYQRMFWFLLGAFLANPFAFQSLVGSSDGGVMCGRLLLRKG